MSKTLDKTMMALVFERYVAPLTTNTAHARCGIVFIRMLSYLTTALRDRTKSENGDVMWIPDARELALTRNQVDGRGLTGVRAPDECDAVRDVADSTLPYHPWPM